TDEPVATLETDKAAVEIAADSPGVLRHARQVGETVVVGDVIARVENGQGELPPSVRPSAAEPRPVAAPSPPSGPQPAAAESRPGPGVEAKTGLPESPPPVAPEPHLEDGARLTPGVRRMVEELGLDPSAIPASGRGGRLLKEDVQRFVERSAGATRPEAGTR